MPRGASHDMQLKVKTGAMNLANVKWGTHGLASILAASAHMLVISTRAPPQAKFSAAPERLLPLKSCHE